VGNAVVVEINDRLEAHGLICFWYWVN